MILYMPHQKVERELAESKGGSLKIYLAIQTQSFK